MVAEGAETGFSRFEFASAGRIVFGYNSAEQLAGIAGGLGRSVFVLTGGSSERTGWLFEDLKRKEIEFQNASVVGEPTVNSVKEAVETARLSGSDMVVAVGGGSVIDTGKAVAAMLTNSGELEDYLEVVGRGKRLEKPSAPFVAVPTTAGTGSEVTRNAVLGVPGRRVKVSMRSAHMLPRVALIDPGLTLSMPAELTASTGLDALTQLIEAFVSKMANPVTDALCREGLQRAGRSLQKAVEDGSDRRAREDMALAGHFSGLALANSKLGAVHGLAGPLGGMIPVAHGLLCAVLLPVVVDANISALKQKDPNGAALTKYDEIGCILCRKKDAGAVDCSAWLAALCSQLGVQGLGELGMQKVDFSELIAKSVDSSSMKGNPVKLDALELENLLNEAF